MKWISVGKNKDSQALPHAYTKTDLRWGIDVCIKAKDIKPWNRT